MGVNWINISRKGPNETKTHVQPKWISVSGRLITARADRESVRNIKSANKVHDERTLSLNQEDFIFEGVLNFIKRTEPQPLGEKKENIFYY